MTRGAVDVRHRRRIKADAEWAEHHLPRPRPPERGSEAAAVAEYRFPPRRLFKSIREPEEFWSPSTSHSNSCAGLRSPRIDLDISGVDPRPRPDRPVHPPRDAAIRRRGIVVRPRGQRDLMAGPGRRPVRAGSARLGYHAFDDGHEVLISAGDRRRTFRTPLDRPSRSAAERMSMAGFGAYPSLFVGKFAHLMTAAI